MPTNRERRGVAARLRELPIDMPSEMDKWEEDGLFIEPSIDDEVDYSQIHHVLLGCFPADHMHPCDYEELHARLADLIEPEERTCYMRDASWDDGQCTWGCICSECGAKHEHKRSGWMNFCPNCGAKVVDDHA